MNVPVTHIVINTTVPTNARKYPGYQSLYNK